MTAEELHTLVFFIIDKNGGQGDISNEEENNIYNRAQYQYQNYLIGEIQQYQYGRPISRIDYSQNEKIRQRLTEFITELYPLSISGGIALFPTNYLLTDAMFTDDMKVIRFVAQDRLANVLDSTIDPVTEENPIYTLSTDRFTFYPSSLTSANLVFVNKAPEIKYAVTYDVNNRPVYDPDNSINPVWSEIDMSEIIVRVLAMMGVPLQLQQVQGYAQNIKTNGQ